jgi:hypothetical protein
MIQNWKENNYLLFLRLAGPVAQLNRVFDYGSKGFRFES